MGLSGVGANSHNTGGITNIINGISHRPTTKGCGQTGHSGRMSEAGTVVNIVGIQHGTAEFLDDIVVFIGTLG